MWFGPKVLEVSTVGGSDVFFPEGIPKDGLFEGETGFEPLEGDSSSEVWALGPRIDGGETGNGN